MGKMFKGVAVAVLLACAWPVLAEPVIVKETGKPPQTQPDQTTTPTPATTPTPVTTPTPQPAPRRYVLPGGDWAIAQALQAVKLSDDQKAKLQPTVDELTKAGQDETAAQTALWKKMQDAYKAAKAAGTKPADDPTLKGLADELSKLSADRGKAVLDRRAKLLAAMEGVVSPEQLAKARDTFERFSTDTATRNKPLARDWIRQVTPGVTLSEQQRDEIVAKLAPIQEKFGLQIAELQKAQNQRMQELYKQNPKDWQNNWQTANKEFAPKLEEVRTALAKALNEAVEAALTPEQRQQAAAGRNEVWQKSVTAWGEQTLKSYTPAQLTDEQTVRAKEIIAAGVEAMLKTDLYDATGRAELAKNVREDIGKLLTDEQKKKVK